MPSPRWRASPRSTVHACARSSNGASRSLRCPTAISTSIRGSAVRHPRGNVTRCRTTAPSTSMGRYALKNDGEFLVADALGDIAGEGDGLYSNDTRLLSQLSLTVG